MIKLTKWLKGHILLDMWKIFEKKSLVKELIKVPLLIKKHYEVWKRIVEMDGPQGLRKIKAYHDEALKGIWIGYRSSRLNNQWRIIYKLESSRFEVFVIEVNPHEY